MIKIARLLFPVLLLMSAMAFGQINSYEYKRELLGVTDRWHTIELPQDVLAKMQNKLSDMRIYGITNDDDTLEVPYLLNVLATENVEKKVGFSMLNFSKNEIGYFYTFQIDNEDLINQISLNFYKSNFDWRIKLEGSQNQNEWFTILDDYRILDIHTDDTKFNFTKLNFPDSRYAFYRLVIKSQTDPKFESASISSRQINEGKINTYPISVIEVSKKNSKTSVYDLGLGETVRISSISISVKSDFEYYRPIIIKQLIDSIETEKGMKYTYQTLANGTLNSFEPNTFSFAAINASRLKIMIENGDNQPLEIGDITAHGFMHELVARFTEAKADYYLAYGNLNSAKPRYDIARFKDSIPTSLAALSLGDATLIPKKDQKTTLPLFESKRWLWAILILVIALLGWFSLKMMRAKTKNK